MFFISFVILSCSKEKYDTPNIPKTYVNISSFRFLQTITDKLFNNPFKSYTSKESEPSDKLQSIRNTLHSLVNFIIQLLLLILFIKFVPFDSLKDFKRYWRHTPIGTQTILILFIVVYILSIILDLFHPNFLLELFCNNQYLVYEQKQYWRPFTSVFLHSDLFHLITYSLLVFIYCPILEKYMGTTTFIFIIYLCTTFDLLLNLIYIKFFSFKYSEDFTTGFGTIFLYYIWRIYDILNIKEKPERMIPSNRSSPSPSPLKVYKGYDYTYFDAFKINDNIFGFVVGSVTIFLMKQNSLFDCIWTMVLRSLIIMLAGGTTYNLEVLSLLNLVYPIIIVSYFIIYLIYF